MQNELHPFRADIAYFGEGLLLNVRIMREVHAEDTQSNAGRITASKKECSKIGRDFLRLSRKVPISTQRQPVQ